MRLQIPAVIENHKLALKPLLSQPEVDLVPPHRSPPERTLPVQRGRFSHELPADPASDQGPANSFLAEGVPPVRRDDDPRTGDGEESVEAGDVGRFAGEIARRDYFPASLYGLSHHFAHRFPIPATSSRADEIPMGLSAAVA